MPTSRRLLVVAYAACALIWGTTWYAIRACVTPEGYPAAEALVLRFGLAAAILLAVASRLRPWPRGARTWLWLGGAGTLNATGYTLVYASETHISGGLAAVLSGVQPLLMALLLTVTGLERVGRASVVGAVVSLVGVGALFFDRLDVASTQALGIALALGSVVCATIYQAIMKRHGEGTHPVVATAVFVTATALALVVAWPVRGVSGVPWPPPLGPTLALLHLALLGSVVAFATYFWLLARVSLMTSGTLAFVFPLVALAVDAIARDATPLTTRAWLGVGLTLAGLALGLRDRGR